MEDKPKTLLFGGSFNPITTAHLLCARFALEENGFTSVQFIPCGDAPHKKNLENWTHRSEMVKLACENHCKGSCFDKGISWSNIEGIWAEDGKKSYSINTYRYFKTMWPDHDYYWMIGGDCTSELHKWHNFSSIKNEMKFAIVNRKGFEETAKTDIIIDGIDAIFLTAPLFEISSTMVRERVAASKPIDLLVPDSVNGYISKNGLYVKPRSE